MISLIANLLTTELWYKLTHNKTKTLQNKKTFILSSVLCLEEQVPWMINGSQTWSWSQSCLTIISVFPAPNTPDLTFKLTALEGNMELGNHKHVQDVVLQDQCAPVWQTNSVRQKTLHLLMAEVIQFIQCGGSKPETCLGNVQVSFKNVSQKPLQQKHD